MTNGYYHQHNHRIGAEDAMPQVCFWYGLEAQSPRALVRFYFIYYL